MTGEMGQLSREIILSDTCYSNFLGCACCNPYVSRYSVCHVCGFFLFIFFVLFIVVVVFFNIVVVDLVLSWLLLLLS